MSEKFSHYCDLRVGGFGLSASQHSKLIYSVHGYLRRHPERKLALDFPGWESGTDKIGPMPGDVLRLHGSEEGLVHCMRNASLGSIVDGEGGYVGGIIASPAITKERVIFSRCHKVDRLLKLLRNTHKIVTSGKEGDPSIDESNLATKIGVPVGRLQAINTISEQLVLARRETVRLVLQSETTGRSFGMHIRRDVSNSGCAIGNFSTYGLSTEGSSLKKF